MSAKSATVGYSLSEVEARRARGEDQTRADAPEAESPGEDFWKHARVVTPPRNPRLTDGVYADVCFGSAHTGISYRQ
jgi:hypothetical protein